MKISQLTLVYIKFCWTCLRVRIDSYTNCLLKYRSDFMIIFMYVFVKCILVKC